MAKKYCKYIILSWKHRQWFLGGGLFYGLIKLGVKTLHSATMQPLILANWWRILSLIEFNSQKHPEKHPEKRPTAWPRYRLAFLNLSSPTFQIARAMLAWQPVPRVSQQPALYTTVALLLEYDYCILLHCTIDWYTSHYHPLRVPLSITKYESNLRTLLNN